MDHHLPYISQSYSQALEDKLHTTDAIGQLENNATVKVMDNATKVRQETVQKKTSYLQNTNLRLRI